MLPSNKNALTVFWNSTTVSKITGEKKNSAICLSRFKKPTIKLCSTYFQQILSDGYFIEFSHFADTRYIFENRTLAKTYFSLWNEYGKIFHRKSYQWNNDITWLIRNTFKLDNHCVFILTHNSLLFYSFIRSSRPEIVYKKRYS